MVVNAGQNPTLLAQAAMEELCGIYRYPVYAYARRAGCSHEDAEDLVQEFFADFLRRRAIAGVGPRAPISRRFAPPRPRTRR